MDSGLEDRLVERLAALACEQLGFSPRSIRPELIRQMLRAELRRAGGSPDLLLQRLEEKDVGLQAALRGAVVVGETYFFRQAEHFELLFSSVIPELAAEVGGPLRAWSAGCSTGEETYSLAACFLAARLPLAVEVVGTDISASSLQVARAGLYTRWSSRLSSPPPFPLHAPHGPDQLRVLGEVAALARFVEHNLLDAARPWLGEVHVVFCRNVLAYFSAPAARIALEHLVDALAPGGYAFFGTVDVERRPPGLEEVRAGGLQVFRKPRPSSRQRPGTPRTAAAAPVAQAEAARPVALPVPGGGQRPAVELHLRALRQIERGQRAGAETDLEELRRREPSYLPGLLELSLLHLRNGRRAPAEALMRELLRRAGGRGEDEPCEGPETLPVSYYRTAARALLSGPGPGGEP